MVDRTETSSPYPDSLMATSLPEGADSNESTEPTLITVPENVSTSPDRTLHLSEVASDCSSPGTVVKAPLSPHNATASLGEGTNTRHYGDDSKSTASLPGSPDSQSENILSNDLPPNTRDLPTGNAQPALEAHSAKGNHTQNGRFRWKYLPTISDHSSAPAAAAANGQSGVASGPTILLPEAVINSVVRAEIARIFQPTKSLKPDESKPSTVDEPKDPILDIAILSPEKFKTSTPSFHKNPKRPGHLISDPTSRTLYTIEVVMKESTYPNSQPLRKRYIHHKPSEASFNDRQLLDVPDRITKVKLHFGGRRGSVEEPTSMVFLYPFKFFVTFANEVKAKLDRLKTKFNRDGQPEHLRTSTSADDVASNDSPLPTTEGEYDSRKAFEYLALVTQLMDKYLKPIFDLRESYRNATHGTIFFQDLWLLFKTGGLVFEREPLPDHPPQINSLIHCNGGRQLLNNSEYKSQEPRRDIPAANSKGLENQLCIHHYHLDFNGELYGPKGERLTIPAWEGERSVYDLKLYPLSFSRPHKDHKYEKLNDYTNHLVRRGRGFVELGAIDHRYYSGELIGTHHEYYSSPVVIDFKLQKRDTEPLSGLLGWMDNLLRSGSDLDTGLSIYPGDPREVQEGTLRANSTEECNFAGCDGNDFIHDDILLDHVVAHQKLVNYGRTSAKFQ
ncbi:MAG: hypothetical protein Q9207_007565 [Kuettlingeria erythrocarpa]